MIRSTLRHARVLARAALATLALLTVAGSAAHAQITCLGPTGVSASDGTNCSNVIVTWSGGSHGDTFKIFRSTTIDGQPTLIGQTTLSTLTDSQAAAGVVFFYWVQKFNSTCPAGSFLSGPNSGFIGTPETMTGVAASDLTSCASAHVSWNASQTALLYQVWRSPTSNVNSAVPIAVTDTTIFDDTTANPGVTYFYFVRGVRGGCIGNFQTVPEPGGRKLTLLPDLVLVEEAFDPPIVVTYPDEHSELLFTSLIANAGTAPFDYRHTHAYADGTIDFTQTYVDVCAGGNVKLRLLGRGPIPDASQPTTFAHFMRVTLRERAPGDVPGVARAQVDLPARCVRDGDAYFSTLPGSPASPQFTACSGSPHGISVGWGYRTGIGGDGQRIDLHCVGNGDYFLEAIIDPDDLIEELDETNNTILVPFSLSNLPSFDPIACPAFAIDATLLGPDSLAAAASALSDTFTARAWVAGVSAAPGPPALADAAQIGYALASEFNFGRARAGVDPWTWSPATWVRQDGEADVWSGKVSVPVPGEYVVTFRFNDFDGLFVMTDLTGTNDGFQVLETSKLSVRATTGVGDGPTQGVPLALAALSNAAARTTRFRVGLPEATTATVVLFDVRGRRVRGLAHGPENAGEFMIEWDGRDEGGRAMPPGLYFARLETSAGARLTTKFFAVTR